MYEVLVVKIGTKKNQHTPPLYSDFPLAYPGFIKHLYIHLRNLYILLLMASLTYIEPFMSSEALGGC